MKKFIVLLFVVLSLQGYVVYPEGNHCYVKVSTSLNTENTFLKFDDKIYNNTGVSTVYVIVQVAASSKFSPCQKIKCNDGRSSYVCVDINVSKKSITRSENILALSVGATDDVLSKTVTEYDIGNKTFKFSVSLTKDDYPEHEKYFSVIKNRLDVGYELVYNQTSVGIKANASFDILDKYSSLNGSNYSPDVEHLFCYGKPNNMESCNNAENCVWTTADVCKSKVSIEACSELAGAESCLKFQDSPLDCFWTNDKCLQNCDAFKNKGECAAASWCTWKVETYSGMCVEKDNSNEVSDNKDSNNSGVIAVAVVVPVVVVLACAGVIGFFIYRKSSAGAAETETEMAVSKQSEPVDDAKDETEEDNRSNAEDEASTVSRGA